MPNARTCCTASVTLSGKLLFAHAHSQVPPDFEDFYYVDGGGYLRGAVSGKCQSARLKVVVPATPQSNAESILHSSFFIATGRSDSECAIESRIGSQLPNSC